MGLFETLQRKAQKLELGTKVIRLLPRLSLLATLVSLAIIVTLPLDGQYRNTYISENALMPSQAYSYFRETEWNILRGYRSEIEHYLSEDVETKNAKNEAVASWLHEFGVKTAVYSNNVTGDTLYGVLHAPRGDGTEAIVLCVPWHNADNEYNIGGTALGVSLARYFSRWPIWSKNIIVVFSENPKDALRSWVEAYHTSLDLTGGSIEAAVILDYPGTNDFFEHVEIHYEGLNGELPNLDLINIAVSITEHEGMKVSLHGLPISEMNPNDFWSRLRLLLLGIRDSALAGVKKSYGNDAFSGWRIQALTLKSVGTQGRIDITTFGRIPEAMFRSINNLLEKFHQSFFFYLLLAPRYFVSISSYLPSTVLLSITFAIASLNAYLNNVYGFTTLFSYTLTSAILWFVSLFVSFAIAHTFLTYDNGLYLLLLNAAILLSPLGLSKIITIKEPMTYRTRAIGFLYFSLLSTSLLMVNFPLAFCIGLLAFPMTLVKTITTHDQEDMIKTRLKNTVLLLVSNPFFSVLIMSSIFATDEFKGLEIFSALTSAWKDLNCWTWFVLCIGWLPVWILCVLSTFTSTPVPISSTLIDETKKSK